MQTRIGGGPLGPLADSYEMVKRIGEGRFGVVFLAARKASGDRVAIKKVRARRLMAGLSYDPWSRSAEREVEVLSRAQHCNVVRMLDHHVAADIGTYMMVYEYLPWDLTSLILARPKPMDESCTKAVMLMLFAALVYLHEHQIMHRDLKPGNLLFDTATGTLKIADFGSSRFCGASLADVGRAVEGDGMLEGGEHNESGAEELTREVCTRWYKSPEMLFGSVDYTSSVDLWAAGCILGEMLSLDGKAIFPGGTDIDQLCRIFANIGTVQEEDWPEAKRLPDYGKLEFTPVGPKPFGFESSRSPESVRLLHSLLRLNPAHRFSAAASLEEDFFIVEPQPLDPPALLEGLGEEPPEVRPEDQEWLRGSDYCSDDSGLGCPPEEFEPIDIETTTCGLWDDRMSLLEAENPGEAASQGGSGTPPPPTRGVWGSELRVRPLVFAQNARE